MTSKATRMRDAGRSWTEIADELGVTVAEAKEAVQEDKKARREGLSKTLAAEERNGLRDVCGNYACNCMRKEHEDFSGRCLVCGPERVEKDEDGYKHDRGCNEFIHKKRVTGLPWWNLPRNEDPHYIDPDMNLSPRINIQAYQLGVQRKIQGTWLGGHRRRTLPDIQQPTLETLTRRARKKLKQGKKVKRHYDAPRKNEPL
jgi:hypothetical protein